MELNIPYKPSEKKSGGLFKKGSIPWNKGKKMHPKTKEKLEKTMFKKGHETVQPDVKTLPKHTKQVHMYSLKNKYIRTFKSITKASKATGIIRRNIGRTANGERRTAGGFKWKFNE